MFALVPEVADRSVSVWLCRYFLRKLKKVKKSNGQILAFNEVSSSPSF
jgi:hypothetical protein